MSFFNLSFRIQLTKKLADARCCVTINQSLYTTEPYIICANRTIEKVHRLRVCQQLFFLWKYKKPDKIELFVVRITGVEPAWAQCSHGPEPCASAYSAISAYSFLPSEFLHGREVRTEVELIAQSTNVIIPKGVSNVNTYGRDFFPSAITKKENGCA